MNFFVVDSLLMALLTIIAIMAVRQQRLLGVIILSGSYSLIAATWFVVLDAVDVAFTEAAVGAGCLDQRQLHLAWAVCGDISCRHDGGRAVDLSRLV